MFTNIMADPGVGINQIVRTVLGHSAHGRSGVLEFLGEDGLLPALGEYCSSSNGAAILPPVLVDFESHAAAACAMEATAGVWIDGRGGRVAPEKTYAIARPLGVEWYSMDRNRLTGVYLRGVPRRKKDNWIRTLAGRPEEVSQVIALRSEWIGRKRIRVFKVILRTRASAERFVDSANRAPCDGLVSRLCEHY